MHRRRRPARKERAGIRGQVRRRRLLAARAAEAPLVPGTMHALPPFSGTVPAPARFVLDASSFPIATVRREADLELGWSASGDGGTMRFVITSESPAEGIEHEEVACEVDVSDGALVVPREILARLTPVEDGSSVLISWWSHTRVDVDAGDWNVQVGVADAVPGIE